MVSDEVVPCVDVLQLPVLGGVFAYLDTSCQGSRARNPGRSVEILGDYRVVQWRSLYMGFG